MGSPLGITNIMMRLRAKKSLASGVAALGNISDQARASLVSDILQGIYGPGARIPAERELAVQMRTSRISIRQALGWLSFVRLITTRRGSGTVVQPRRNWTFAVLPHYLQALLNKGDAAALHRTVVELLALRRMLFVDILCDGCDSLAPGALDPARRAVENAWAAREDPLEFLQRDFEKNRLLFESAALFASLWLLNSLAQATIDLEALAPTAAAIPDDYVHGQMRFFAALEARDRETAARTIGEFLTSQDKIVLATLGQDEK
jgi:DNA-binding FadR family transcriptional regulator